jgi:hypothetical protein
MNNNQTQQIVEEIDGILFYDEAITEQTRFYLEMLKTRCLDRCIITKR